MGAAIPAGEQHQKQRAGTIRHEHASAVLASVSRDSTARPFGEDPAWPTLDEQNQRDEYQDLSQHGAEYGRVAVDDAERQAADERPPEVSKPTNTTP